MLTLRRLPSILVLVMLTLVMLTALLVQPLPADAHEGF